ncbi:predicted protein [Nematostella vectensis]|uniref:Pentraxin (PTX) domain-containing protein n=1 Tax=Nematostella vectensis TaxID=45351 RepID=A7SVH0_NEMVE|nr:predicted protein [Nematostella vectensis]|eukprot:XP_001624391.1 predicted protein [Nematostella vectensis]
MSDSYTWNNHVSYCIRKAMCEDGHTFFMLLFRLKTQDESATFSDYSNYSSLLNFQAGVLEFKVEIFIIEDNIVENNETFKVILSTDNQTVTVGEQIAFTIIDDDKANFSFASASYSVIEDTGFVTVNITKTSNTDVPLSVILDTRNITANSTVDYVPIENQTVIFQREEIFKLVNISIGVDNATESDEVFQVILTTDNPNQVEIVLSQANITIVNDDSENKNNNKSINNDSNSTTNNNDDNYNNIKTTITATMTTTTNKVIGNNYSNIKWTTTTTSTITTTTTTTTTTKTTTTTTTKTTTTTATTTEITTATRTKGVGCVLHFPSRSTSNYIKLVNPFNDSFAEFTVSWWLKTSIDDKLTIFSYATEERTEALWIYLDKSDIRFICGGSTRNVDYGDIKFDTWQHLMVRARKDVYTLYINNIKLGTGSLSTTGPSITNEGILVLGQRQKKIGGDFGDPFYGYIAHLNMWLTGISDEHVSLVYEHGCTNYDTFALQPALSWNKIISAIIEGDIQAKCDMQCP